MATRKGGREEKARGEMIKGGLSKDLEAERGRTGENFIKISKWRIALGK